LAENLWEEVTLDLQNIIINGVAKYEVSLIGGMGVQVDVHKESFVATVVQGELFDSITRRLFLEVWSLVVPIEISIEDIHSTVTT
jgi:hypothetical protein